MTVLNAINRFLDWLSSPTLPPKILIVMGGIATTIIVIGVGVWSIIGACKAFRALIRS